MPIFADANSWYWLFLENYIYNIPEPSPRVRTKPMEVLCVGPPRSATESLQHALLILGYDHTYHGWDVMFEERSNIPAWVRLCRKKYFGDRMGERTITAEDFDKLLGHAVAVTDAPANALAFDIIQAYPEAKVVLNTRRNLDKWHESAVTNLVDSVNRKTWLWALTWFDANFFWMWSVWGRFLWYRLFRGYDGTLSSITVNGKWIYKEHCAMVRGMVPKERLLEWSIEDGWEPLCKFLGKPVPDEPFPNTNNAAGFQARVDYALKKHALNAFRNMAITAVILGLAGWQIYKRFPKISIEWQ